MNNIPDNNTFNWPYNNSIIKIMESEKEEFKKSLLNKTGIKLTNLLRSDMNSIRIKNSSDIEDFIKLTQRSLYPSYEKTKIDIYNFTDNNDSIISDLSLNYDLTEKYLHTFKSVMNNELNKIFKNVVIKKMKLKKIEEQKFQKKIETIKQNDKETKIERECLNKISILPNDIIRLIESYTLTPRLRLILIKQKYDNVMFNIIKKMNVKELNKFINKTHDMRKRIYIYLCHNERSKNMTELLKEYDIFGNFFISTSITKTLKIKKILDNMDNHYKFLTLLQNMNKYSEICEKIIEHLIKCYNTYIYISNRTTEQNIIKRNQQKLNRQSNRHQQQQSNNQTN
jgi:hypothetical protein